MGLIVQKFGGSSVADAARVRNVASIIIDTYKQGNNVVVVVSAQGDTTDDLIAHLGGSTDESAASEAITPEMSLKMMENSPLRAFRSFMGISTEELEEFSSSSIEFLGDML